MLRKNDDSVTNQGSTVDTTRPQRKRVTKEQLVKGSGEGNMNGVEFCMGVGAVKSRSFFVGVAQ